MKLRNKLFDKECSSGEFNVHAMAEIIVYYPDDVDTDYIRNFDVQLPDGTWKDLGQAFRDHDVITNNANTRFFFPTNDEDRARGYSVP